MRIGRTAAAVSSLAVLVGGAFALASPASAGQTWYQSVGRASATAACPTSPQGDLDAGWTEWAPSWEEWAQDGNGGYVCSRSIMWAKDTPPPSGGNPDVVLGDPGDSGDPGGVPASAACLPLEAVYINFGGSYFASGYGEGFTDAGCTEPYDAPFYRLVYAPAPYDAQRLCLEAFGTVADFLGPIASDVYRCAY